MKAKTKNDITNNEAHTQSTQLNKKPLLGREQTNMAFATEVRHYIKEYPNLKEIIQKQTYTEGNRLLACNLLPYSCS